MTSEEYDNANGLDFEHKGGQLRDLLAGIADQIGREQDALVADSPYDALPPEDREAIAWVREHGGVDAVRERWDGRVDIDVVSRMVEGHKAKRDRLKAHALWLERKCHERQEHICELNKLKRAYVDALNGVCKRIGLTDGTGLPEMPEVIWAELDRRLMPEGMEWLVEAWPRFEDGEPVRFEDEWCLRTGGTTKVGQVVLVTDWSFALNASWYEPGERVKRPAPKDSWERLEEDVANASCPDVYCANHHIDASDASYEWAMARDIVRRAKALSGGA